MFKLTLLPRYHPLSHGKLQKIQCVSSRNPQLLGNDTGCPVAIQLFKQAIVGLVQRFSTDLAVGRIDGCSGTGLFQLFADPGRKTNGTQLSL